MYRMRYLPSGFAGRAFISANLALRYSRKSKSIIVVMAAPLHPAKPAWSWTVAGGCHQTPNWFRRARAVFRDAASAGGAAMEGFIMSPIVRSRNAALSSVMKQFTRSCRFSALFYSQRSQRCGG